uniref:Granulins domain-containing protein n=1 Tax=Ditylenchus dipsaci TaxID=166011 RepID=A0A915CZQ7_9BILA
MLLVSVLSLLCISFSAAAIICPDKLSECPDETTCCQLEGGSFGCCPLEKAVCCADKLHCCPQATTCDTEHGRCNSGRLHLPIHKKQPSQPVQSSSKGRRELLAQWAAAIATQKQHNLAKLNHETDLALSREEVTCPDKKSKCPAHTTCCALNLYTDEEDSSDFVALGPEGVDTVYGCCPAEHAVCCPDKLHCCPEGTTCDVQESRCVQQQTGYSRPWLEKFGSTKIIRKPAVALDGPSHMTCHSRKLTEDELWELQGYQQGNTDYHSVSQCLSGNTCCLQTAYNEHKPTCCPFSKGQCCAGGTHCCPSGFHCTTLDRKCMKMDANIGSTVLSVSSKSTTRAKERLTTPEVVANDVECPDGSKCGPLNSCCPVRSTAQGHVQSYECCPLSKANCCADTCCPLGYACTQGKRCEKNSLLELISSFGCSFLHEIGLLLRMICLCLRPDREPMFKQNLFSDGREAMLVWKNLRSSYKKKKDKKLPSGSASEPEKQKWVHYAEMDFLKNHIEDRIAQSSTLVQCPELVIDEEGENQLTSKRECLSSPLSQSSPVVRKKARVLDEFESKMLELVEKEEVCTLARDVDDKMKKISGVQHARMKMAFERAVREQIYQVDEYLLDNQMLRSKLALLVLLRRRKRLKKGRRYWVHPLWRNRPELGAYSALLPQLKANPDKFIDYMRMNPEVFATLLQALNERLTKYSIRTPICAEERLMLTIRHLATGESYRSLSFQFRMGCMTVCRIISDTCSAIYEVLRQDYLAMPKTAEEWHQVALRFWEKSNIPNTLGAIDGKHVLIRKPAGSGTNFFNYKSRTSTVLMAICDADYNCIYASFGHYGHMSDGLKNNLIILPLPARKEVVGRTRSKSPKPRQLRKQANEERKVLERSESAKGGLHAKNNDTPHTLQRSYSENDKYSFAGAIVVTGNHYLLSLVSGNNKIKVLNDKSVHMRGATRRGGQSAPRFGRINKMNKQTFLKNIAEDAYKRFTQDGRPIISTLIIAGIAQGKDKLLSMLDKSLQNLVSSVSSVNQKGEGGLNQALKKLEKDLSLGNLQIEQEALDNFFTQLADKRCVYTFNSVIKEIEEQKVKKLVVYEHLDMKGCTIRHIDGTERFQFMTNKQIQDFNKGIKPKHIKERLVEPCQELAEYVEGNFAKVSVIRISEETIKQAKYKVSLVIMEALQVFCTWIICHPKPQTWKATTKATMEVTGKATQTVNSKALFKEC